MALTMTEARISRHAEAMTRFEKAQQYWGPIQERMTEDMKFALGDSTNNWQWPAWALTKRRVQKRPHLSINKLPQHINQVVNEIRQNMPQGKARGASGEASEETAEILTGLMRRIWNAGEAPVAVSHAAFWQVTAGCGYFYIANDWIDDGSFEQDLFVRQVRDPTAVIDDPLIELPTGEDRRFLFLVEEMAKEEFQELYPDAAMADVDQSHSMAWFADETVRVARYWYKAKGTREIGLYADGTTAYVDLRTNERPLRTKSVKADVIKCDVISGAEILEEHEWPGSTIPFVRVVGVDMQVENERVVKGLVRNAMDAQAMYNFWATSYAEHVALAPKAPFIGPKGFAEGSEDVWQTANDTPHAYLEYNPVDASDGSPLPPPSRAPGPDIPAGYVQGMMQASDDIKATTGQYDASLGARGNETSGRAINARQRESDTANFHFIDNVAKAVEYASRIMVEVLPKLYDTRRVARITGEDGTEDLAYIDPNSPQAMQKIQHEEGEIKSIYNFAVGRYDVVVTTGPSYATKRAEAADMMTQLAQGDPTIMAKAGDIIVRNFDMPGAEELSKRLKLFLPPEIRQAEEAETGGQQQLPPQVQAAVQQIEQANAMLDAKAQELSGMQQQVEQGKSELAGRADSIRADMQRLQMEKQLAEAEVKAARDQLTNEVQKKEFDLALKAMELDQREAEMMTREKLASIEREAIALASRQTEELSNGSA